MSTRTTRRPLAAAAVAGALVAGLLTTGGLEVGLAPSADAAAPGQRTVGTTAVALSQPSDNLLGRMTPAADAAERGMFAPQVGWPVIPVHAVLASNGHLVTYGTPTNVAAQGGRVYDDWDPSYGTVAQAHTQADSMGTYDSFCNALVTLADGRMLMVGGNGDGGSSDETMYYDPVTKQESMGAGLNKQRWYATVLRRPDDQVVTIGGGNYYVYNAYLDPNDADVATTPEIGSGTGTWSLLNGARSSALFGAAANRWWYPRAYNAADGSVVGISGDRLWRMTTTNGGSIAQTGTMPTSIGASGSTVMYAPGKLLATGGNEVANGTRTTATNAATVVDVTNPGSPRATAVAPMANRRQWHNLTVLPTGDVLANGGTVVGTDGGEANSSYTAELWNPATQQWRTAAKATRIRTYHSVSALLPSGAVFTGGGGVPGPEDNFNAETYYPPSLFTKAANGQVTWASRPTITSVAGSLTWGGRITLGTNDSRTISSVSLISTPTVTHSYNTDQRRIPLSFTQSGASLSVTMPSSANTVPPGTYLLSTVDSKGVPSPSQLVTFKRNAAGTVNVFQADSSAGRVGPAGRVDPGVVPLTVGSTVSFEAADNPYLRLRGSNGTAGLTTESADLDNASRAATGFVVRAGLSGTGVSLESAATPGSFLVLRNGTVSLAARSGDGAYAASASWKPERGLQGNYTSLTNVAVPSAYLRKTGNGAIVGQTFEDSDQFRADTTFSVRPPLNPRASTYSLTNANSNLVLTTDKAGVAAGTKAVQGAAGGPVTQWELRPTADGHVKIVNGQSGLVLGVEGASGAAGAQALVWNDTGTRDHLWDVFPRNGRWIIRNANSGLVLGITNMSGAAGANALQWNDTGTLDHQWLLNAPDGAPAAGTYRIVNRNSGLSLDTRGSGTAAGTAVTQGAASGSTTQRWTLEATNQAGVFKIRNGGSNRVLGILRASKDVGATALVWDDTGTADHLWRPVRRGDDWLLQSVNSGLVLGVRTMGTAGNEDVLQWDDNGTRDHLWQLTAP